MRRIGFGDGEFKIPSDIKDSKVDDGALRRGLLDNGYIELHVINFITPIRHARVWASTERTGGRSRTMAVQVSPESGEA